MAFLVIAILASRDLEERFERAPSRVRWLPNAWAALPARDMRQLRWCVYALGALAAGLGYAWGNPFTHYAAPPLYSLGVVGALIALIVLLAAGRAPALPLVPVVCMPIAIALATQIPNAEHWLAGECAPLAYDLERSPQLAIPGTILALLASALALPYALRLLRRAA